MESPTPAIASPGPSDTNQDAALTRGMEHMRPYVSVQADRASVATSLPVDDASVYGVPSSLINPTRQPQRRPRSPSNNQKRTDPFSFGSRYLEEGDDVFEFNAWDHVEVDDAFKGFAEEQYQRQREAPVSDFDRYRINMQPAKPWNRFYSNNSSNFFKNRKWLFQEFPTLSAAVAAPTDTNPAKPIAIMEIGAGAGNTAFPLLAANQNPSLKIHALDFSSAAVKVMREDPNYDECYIQADVWDLAAAPPEPALASDPAQSPSNATLNPSLPTSITPGTIDIAILIFTLSALSPTQWQQGLLNIYTALKPGGEVLFRDYGHGDLAQVRFKKGRWMGENFYVRGDGTRVYFFAEEELREIWTSGGRNARSITDGDSQASLSGREKPLAGAEAAPGQGESAGEDRSMDTEMSPPPTSHADRPDSEAGTRTATTESTNMHNSVVEQEPSPVSFEVLNLGTDRRMLINRKRKLKMYRCWMQGRFRKPLEALLSAEGIAQAGEARSSGVNDTSGGGSSSSSSSSSSSNR